MVLAENSRDLGELSQRAAFGGQGAAVLQACMRP